MSQAEPTSSTTCKNCQTAFVGNFCPNCSQKADTHRLSLLHFIREAIHAITHTDKGIFFLMKELLTKPGTVALEYNTGMRKKYFNPITFLLIMTAIQIFAAQKTGFFVEFTKSILSITEQVASQAREEGQHVISDQASMKKFSVTGDNMRLWTLLYIPLLSFLTWGFFKRSGQNYAENLVLNVMINGQATLLFLLFGIIPFLIYPGGVVLWMCLFFIVSWIYTFMAYRQFYKQNWALTILKGIIVQVLYLICAQQLTTLITGFF